MPVYNSAKFLSLAIESILHQSFSEFEFLIFDDGSTDSSVDIIKSYISDNRIKLFSYPENQGYIARLNEGIRIAKGKYIARMDADDISCLDRFKKQVELLESFPEVGLCGTWYQMIDGGTTVVEISANHDDLKIELILNSTFGHPCVMMRTSVLRDHGLFYDESFMPAEDFRLWVQLSKITQLRNIPEVLLKYRVHSGQISSYKRKLQVEKIQSIRAFQICELLARKLNNSELEMIQLLFGDEDIIPSGPLVPNKAFHWAYGLAQENRIRRIYSISKFEDFIIARVTRLAHLVVYNRTLLFSSAPKLLLKGSPPIVKLKFYIKCLLNWSLS